MRKVMTIVGLLFVLGSQAGNPSVAFVLCLCFRHSHSLSFLCVCVRESTKKNSEEIDPWVPCEDDCHGHGTCEDGICVECDEGWTGKLCNEQKVCGVV